jgi:hypothetical protein
MKKRFAWLILLTSTLLCVIPVVNENLSDPCLSYSSASPPKQLDDCIDFITENRNIANRSQTRSNVEQILLVLVPALMPSDYEHHPTSEGIILSAYANPYRFPNVFGSIKLCDNAFCESEYNSAFKDPSIIVSESVHYKFCLLFCTRSDTTSSSGTSAPCIIIAAKPTMTDGIHPEQYSCTIWKLLIVGLVVTVLLVGGIILLAFILIRKWNTKQSTFSFNKLTSILLRLKSYILEQTV